MSTPQHVLIVIPTYNEADNVVTVLDRIHQASPEAYVLVVDDQSPDGTGDLVHAYVRGNAAIFLLAGGEKQGLGAAYRSGFRWALEHGHDVIVQMDADLSHPPDRLPHLLAALDQADVAVGSRYVPGGSVRSWKLSRRLLSRIGNLYVRRVLQLPVHDTTAGFKAFRRQALLDIGPAESTSNGYCFQIENAWRATSLGLRTAKVPIVFVDREHGSSKMSGAIALEAVARVLVWRLTGQSRATGRAAVSSRTRLREACR